MTQLFLTWNKAPPTLQTWVDHITIMSGPKPNFYTEMNTKPLVTKQGWLQPECTHNPCSTERFYLMSYRHAWWTMLMLWMPSWQFYLSRMATESERYGGPPSNMCANPPYKWDLRSTSHIKFKQTICQFQVAGLVDIFLTYEGLPHLLSQLADFCEKEMRSFWKKCKLLEKGKRMSENKGPI